jgi:hypothetical protein
VACTAEKRVIDIEENASWERLKIHAVPLVRYMGSCKEALQKMQEESEVKNEGMAIPTEVQWLVNPRTIRESRQTGEIAASLVVFVAKGSQVARSLIEKGINAVGV